MLHSHAQLQMAVLHDNYVGSKFFSHGPTAERFSHVIFCDALLYSGMLKFLPFQLQCILSPIP